MDISRAPDPTRDRRLSALMGGFVADAAAMTLHWIYDTDQITTILTSLNRTDSPEFLPTSYCTSYTYPVGQFTPFGEQMYIITEALAASQSVDPQAIADAYTNYYSFPMNTTRPFTSYYDNATKGFLANVYAGNLWPNTGAGDTETNAVAHVLPLVAMRAGRPDFLQDAENVIRVVQNNQDAVAFGLTFARLLERVILGDSVPDAITNVSKALASDYSNPNYPFFSHALAKMSAWSLRPPFDVTLEIGQACDFPFHLFTAPQLLLHHVYEAPAYNFTQAIRDTIKLGGENGDRGSLAGSLLAAAAGSLDAIPLEWQKSTTLYQRALQMAELIVDGGSSWQPPYARSSRPQGFVPAAFAATTSRTGSKQSKLSELREPPSCVPSPSPPTHPDDLKALQALYFSAGGTGWTRQRCWPDASVPVCNWSNVVCDPTSFRVTGLKLAANNLTGKNNNNNTILLIIIIDRYIYFRHSAGRVRSPFRAANSYSRLQPRPWRGLALFGISTLPRTTIINMKIIRESRLSQ
jgi:ADP-ribosylglycohydrolase